MPIPTSPAYLRAVAAVLLAEAARLETPDPAPAPVPAPTPAPTPSPVVIAPDYRALLRSYCDWTKAGSRTMFTRTDHGENGAQDLGSHWGLVIYNAGQLTDADLDKLVADGSVPVQYVDIAQVAATSKYRIAGPNPWGVCIGDVLAPGFYQDELKPKLARVSPRALGVAFDDFEYGWASGRGALSLAQRQGMRDLVKQVKADFPSIRVVGANVDGATTILASLQANDGLCGPSGALDWVHTEHIWFDIMDADQGANNPRTVGNIQGLQALRAAGGACGSLEYCEVKANAVLVQQRAQALGIMVGINRSSTAGFARLI